jgi:hypothetical protein
MQHENMMLLLALPASCVVCRGVNARHDMVSGVKALLLVLLLLQVLLLLLLGLVPLLLLHGLPLQFWKPPLPPPSLLLLHVVVAALPAMHFPQPLVPDSPLPRSVQRRPSHFVGAGIFRQVWQHHMHLAACCC